MPHPHRSQTPRKRAQGAGYYIREGGYQGTADDRLGRWYYGHESEHGFCPIGPGHASQRAAWEAAYEHGIETGRIR